MIPEEVIGDFRARFVLACIATASETFYKGWCKTGHRPMLVNEVQSSVDTRLRRGEIFGGNFTRNLVLSLQVKGFFKIRRALVDV